MIYRLTGRLVEKNPTALVIDVNGVSYEVNVPLTTFDRIGKVGDTVALFTVLVVHEDAMVLYGFGTADEQKLFKLLTSVSGVGPRTALSLLSSTTVEDVYNFISMSNSNALTAIPGIGKKTAERLIVELRDKIHRTGLAAGSDKSSWNEEVRGEAVDALAALGYSRLQCERAIREVLRMDPASGATVEQLVRAALKEVK